MLAAKGFEPRGSGVRVSFVILPKILGVVAAKRGLSDDCQKPGRLAYAWF